MLRPRKVFLDQNVEKNGALPAMVNRDVRFGNYTDHSFSLVPQHINV